MIGHYYYFKETNDGHFAPSYTKTLLPLTEVNFFSVIDTITPACPLKKEDKGYKEWKQENLPLVYFTESQKRPKGDSAVHATGYAMIDLDNNPNVRCVSNHPAVVATNYTGNGTHFFISGVFGATPREWQLEYNKFAWELYIELTAKYGDLKFDGRLSQYDWGCYLWGNRANWVVNGSPNLNYKPTDIELSDEQLNKMYDEDSYWVAGSTAKTSKEKDASEEVIRELADYRGISTEMRNDYLSMRYTDFLDKYSKQYNKITGTEQEFEWYTDYDGNTYEMGKTNGQKVVLWEIWMQHPHDVPTGFDGRPDYRIQKGHRRESIFKRALQTSQFTHDHLDPDHILFDAVLWCVNCCVDGLKFPKKELLEQVSNAITRSSTYDCRLYTDPRLFISGSERIDKGTGEIIPMRKGDKIAANARCRKTERIKEVVKVWNPVLNDDENIEAVRSWIDGMEHSTERTIKSYLKSAQNMPELLDEYPWLKDLLFKKAGRCAEQICIRNQQSGEVIRFSSKKECMARLGIKSRRTFAKFLDGLTKFNQAYEVVK